MNRGGRKADCGAKERESAKGRKCGRGDTRNKEIMSNIYSNNDDIVSD